MWSEWCDSENSRVDSHELELTSQQFVYDPVATPPGFYPARIRNSAKWNVAIGERIFFGAEYLGEAVCSA
jgi:hypothetical protein